MQVEVSMYCRPYGCMMSTHSATHLLNLLSYKEGGDGSGERGLLETGGAHLPRDLDSDYGLRALPEQMIHLAN